MTTAVDFDALEGQTAPRVTLVGNEKIGEDGAGEWFSGFSGISSLYVSAKVQLTARPKGEPGLTLLIEHSDDGITPSTAETFTFGYDGAQDATLASPKDYVRASWSVSGSSEWYLRSVTAAPLASLRGGGSQPAMRPVGPYHVAYTDVVVGDALGAEIVYAEVGAEIAAGDVIFGFWLRINNYFNDSADMTTWNLYGEVIGQPAGTTGETNPFNAVPIDLTQTQTDDHGGKTGYLTGEVGVPFVYRNPSGTSVVPVAYDYGACLPWLSDHKRVIIENVNPVWNGDGSQGDLDLWFLIATPVAP